MVVTDPNIINKQMFVSLFLCILLYVVVSVYVFGGNIYQALLIFTILSISLYMYIKNRVTLVNV